VPRFDLYQNPNPRAGHGLYLDVQSDLVRTATRWCLPLRAVSDTPSTLTKAQLVLTIAGVDLLLDTPDILAVPNRLLSAPVVRLKSDDQLRVESALDFMLRGY
jgi:hypothetical protein